MEGSAPLSHGNQGVPPPSSQGTVRVEENVVKLRLNSGYTYTITPTDQETAKNISRLKDLILIRLEKEPEFLDDIDNIGELYRRTWQYVEEQDKDKVVKKFSVSIRLDVPRSEPSVIKNLSDFQAKLGSTKDKKS